MSGLSISNLWRIKLFYESYTDSTKIAPLVREIFWTHNSSNVEKCNQSLHQFDGRIISLFHKITIDGLDQFNVLYLIDFSIEKYV